MTPAIQNLPIRSAQGDYEVHFSPDIPSALAATISLGDSFFLVDSNVAHLYAGELKPLLDSRPWLAIDATEDEKTLSGVTKVVSWLQKNNATKRSTVVAIGGGIIQDLATFSSHIYYRGIRWVHVPTTLLSMSDSCIGAKCGINLNEFKNQLGVFQSPSGVFIASAFTKTLSDVDVASGYGEILKLMLTGPPDGFERLERAVAAGGFRNPELPALIYESLAVKKVVIEEDEYELDLRRVLNFGHTFGHALESLTSHEVPHGLAVAWGIDLVNHIAASRGLLDPRVFERVHQWILDYMPFRVTRSLAAAELIAAARRDKKATANEVTLILLERPGALKIVKVPFDRELEDQITVYLERHDAFRRH